MNNSGSTNASNSPNLSVEDDVLQDTLAAMDQAAAPDPARRSALDQALQTTAASHMSASTSNREPSAVAPAGSMLRRTGSSVVPVDSCANACLGAVAAPAGTSVVPADSCTEDFDVGGSGAAAATDLLLSDLSSSPAPITIVPPPDHPRICLQNAISKPKQFPDMVRYGCLTRVGEPEKHSTMTIGSKPWTLSMKHLLEIPRGILFWHLRLVM